MIARAVRREAQSKHYGSFEEGMAREASKLRERIKNGEIEKGDSIVEALTIISFAAEQFFGYYPNETQLVAALCLMQGKIAELGTGEGKTLVAVLAASSIAIHGRHVDIATTNDYLAERDWRGNSLIFASLGISLGLVLSTTSRDKRKHEYQKDITYTANQELGFDYLNDNLALSSDDVVRKDLDIVIIDEVDSILIDEARTSLIISHPGNKRAAKDIPNFGSLLSLAEQLTLDVDYTADYLTKTVAFTDEGVKKLVDLLKRDIFREASPENLKGLWQALYAHVFLKKDKDYIVQDGKVILVDAFTGHALPDRRLMEGLHQAVQAMSGVPVTPDDEVVGTITYRNFFRMYKSVAGMTGTAFESRREFYDLYGLEVAVLSPAKERIRRDLATIFFETKDEKFRAVIEVARKTVERNSPLLIVGASIELAEEISRRLTEAAVPHQVLHASVGEEERSIIERAGKPGVITVATNMAGRGADIVIDRSLRLSYGLTVIGLEHNISQRIDNQLRGRSGRQGQYGETQFVVSLEDELFQIYGDDPFWNYAEKIAWQPSGIVNQRLQEEVFRLQERAQSFERESRVWLARFDGVMDRHRHRSYGMRTSMLTAPLFLDAFLKEMKEILFKEEESRLTPDELRVLLDERSMREPAWKFIEAFLIQGRELTPEVIGAMSITSLRLEKARRDVLLIHDDRWKRYLDSISWLQDWVSLTGTGESDPYLYFVRVADKMFHDMRRDFAVSAISATIKSVFT